MCIGLAIATGSDPLLSELKPFLSGVEGVAERILPYVLHLALLQDAGGRELVKRMVSDLFTEWFRKCNVQIVAHVRTMLAAVIYLRKQPFPNEEAQYDRSRWLNIDNKIAAKAASQCSMFKTALVFLENDYSERAKESRRSSGIGHEEPTELLQGIYEHIDEQDSIYGVQQPSNLESLTRRLEYESAGFRSLSFRGAFYDSSLRSSGAGYQADEQSMVRILSRLDLHGLSRSFLGKVTDSSSSSIDSMLSTARKLEQWDLSVPTSHKSDASAVFKAFQGIYNATDTGSIASAIDSGLLDTMSLLMTDNSVASSTHKWLRALASLTETDEVCSSSGGEELYEAFIRFANRSDWMEIERYARAMNNEVFQITKHLCSFDRVDDIWSCRETLFGSLSKNPRLQSLLRTSLHDARAVESQIMLASSKMSRSHGAHQHALARVTHLTQMSRHFEDAGVNIKAAVRFETAQVLWDQGEMSTSIRMLKDLKDELSLKDKSNGVGRPELLAKLVSIASICSVFALGLNVGRDIKYLKPVLRSQTRSLITT